MNKMIEWMTGNKVAANLLMMAFIVGGIIRMGDIKQEVFPEIDLNRVKISVSYPGASPSEIEEGIIFKIEENISSVDGVSSVDSTAYEGFGTVIAEIEDGEDVDLALQDIKSTVDRISTFPEDAEEPDISKVLNLKEVISVIVSGDMSEKSLRQRAEEIKDELLVFDGITQVELGGVKDYEISVEVPEKNLRKYNLTIDSLAAKIRQSSLDLPGGNIKTSGGEILLRTKERKYTKSEYDDIIIIASDNGTQVRLGDIAVVTDGFKESDLISKLDGKTAVMVKVFRVSNQKPIEISKVVNRYVDKKIQTLPDSVTLVTWNDTSELYKSRMDLLTKNAFIGLFLVLIILGIFLEIKLAFWVMLGIPISFFGALFFIPLFDVSINMISLFAFILALGILVDDAIIVGENIFEYRQQGLPAFEAALKGVKEVAVPVCFSILTTVAAFMPLAYVSGVMGKFMRAIPVVVISLLLVSLVECLFVLPAHLSSEKKSKAGKKNLFTMINDFRLKFERRFNLFSETTFKKVVGITSANRYITFACGIFLLLFTIGLVKGGVIKFTFMPEVDGDKISVNLQMPPGTLAKDTAAIADMITRAGLEIVKGIDSEMPEKQSILRNIYAITGGSLGAGGPTGNSGGTTDSNVAEVVLYLTKSEERSISTAEVKKRWRKKVGDIPGSDIFTFSTNLVHMGANIDYQLAHKDYRVLEAVSEKIKGALAGYPGIRDIEDNFAEGKKELKFELTKAARSAGLTEIDIARQIRSAFYGSEALSLQMGRNEVDVMVKYPEADRRTMKDLYNMRIRTPVGGEMPVMDAARITESRGFSEIIRVDSKRVINVSASVDSAIGNADEIIADMRENIIKPLLTETQGLTYSMSGENKEKQDSMQSMAKGFQLALFMIYALLAIPFRSYIQPLIIMGAIPFGLVGAVFGHILMGYNLSMLSIFGVIALSGVVVNDSLIMVDKINRNRREEGMPTELAVINAGARRLRPILLTSLTTFFGLSPMILETSVQAQFLVPMAISLGCGIMFATLITLVLIPSMHMITEDIKNMFGMAD